MRIAVVATAMCFSICSLAMADGARAAVRKPTQIAAQPLGAALKELAAGCGLQVLFFSDAVRDLRTQGAAGDITPDEAFTQILAGTGLTYRYIDNQTVTILPIAQDASNAGPATRPTESGTHATSSANASKDADNTASTQDQKAGRSFWERFRLAQVDQRRAATDASVSRTNDDAGTPRKPLQLEEVVVTGTHILGEPPVGASVKTYSHEDIATSGATTVDQFARHMVENFTSADSVANTNTNIAYSRLVGPGVYNGFSGSALDLHGVGPTATLTLLNGHRLASGGYDGSVTDISQIPLSAVDHIDVLADGASAIYGADAVAGVVNIVTRKDFSGAETSVRYGSATDGGAGQFTGSQALGTAWSTGNAFINYEFNRQDSLDASDRDYIPDYHGPEMLLPDNKTQSVLVSGRQELGADTTLSADLTYADRNFDLNGTSYSDVYDGSMTSAGTTKSSGATVSLDHLLFGDWHANLSGNYTRLDQDSVSTNDLTFGPISQHSEQDSHVDSRVSGADLMASGSLFALPGGAIKAAVGASYRRETFLTTQVQTIDSATSTFAVPEAQRHVESAFVELAVPLISTANALPGVQRLQFSAAGRTDHYSDFGSTTNPRLGLSWAPVTGVEIRGSYGKSFRAPLLNQLSTLQNAVTHLVADPAAPGGIQDLLILNGGNPGLQAEHSKSFTAGFDLRPPTLPLTFGATYFHIDFSDRIAVPPLVGQNYFHDPSIASFLTLNPSLAEVQAIFASAASVGDYATGGPSAVTAIFDNRNANISSSKVSGVDATATYDLQTDIGHFGFTLGVARLLDNDFQPIAGVPTIVLLGTYGEPTKWKGRGGVAWRAAGFAANLSVNHVSGYDNTLFTPTTEISSWTTADVYFSYDFGALQVDALKGLRAGLSVSNLTNKEPPYAPLPPEYLLPGQASIPYDSANASPVGRLIAVQVSKRW